MTNKILKMQIGAQRQMLGWLPEIAARRDARLMVGLGLAGAAFANPAAVSAAEPPPPADAGSNAGCTGTAITNITKIINYATNALIAIIGAVVILRFAMAAWTMVASNKANRGKKALNDIMWVGAGLIVVVMVFPLRWGILQVVGALFPQSGGDTSTLAKSSCIDNTAK